MTAPALERNLEFVRAEDAGDAYAFRSGVQEYLVRRGDGSFEAVRVRWDDTFAAELAALRDPGSDPELPRRLGDRLREWFAAGINLEAIAAAHQRGEALRLRIVSSAAELYALPWELLTLPGSGAHLGAAAHIELTYRWPAAPCAPLPPAPRPEGGRLLFAWSRAFGPVGERLIASALAEACASGQVPWNTSDDELGDLSLPALVARLERAAPAVLHLLCHGAPVGDGYGLGLDDGRGGRVVVDSGALARALAPFAGQVRLVVLTACDSSNPGAPGTRLGSIAQELHRAGFEAVVASRLPLSGIGALEFSAELYRALLVDTCSIDQAFAAARARLLRLPGSLDWASVQLHQHVLPGSDRRPLVFRPYRGLLAFEERHARFFYGRDAERDEMLADLAALRAAGRPRLLVVAGASGTGKSSVVLAGVCPALAARGWVTTALRPGAAPRRALTDALARVPPGRPFALIVDQFEELFTHGDPAEAAAFARELWALARQPGVENAVIITLRVDFLGRCGELTLDDERTRLDQIAYDEAHRIFVARMATGRLAEAISRPAERVGLRLEEGLCARLLKDVGDEPGALPLLQYALDALWAQRAGDVLTHATLDAIGGVGGAMIRHADRVIAGLDETARAQARRALVRLVAYGSDMASGTRRRVALADLRPEHAAEAFERAVAALVDARLLQRDDEGATLEVSHEALIRRWSVLWDWYQADRERLARQAEFDELVADARRYGVLLTGRALERARELAAELGVEVRPEAHALIAASRRSKHMRRLRRIAAVVAAFVVLGGGAIAATTFSVRTELARQTLADLLARARDAERIAAAERLLEGEPWAAAALLREVSFTDLPRWRQVAFAATQEVLPDRFLPGARPPGVFTGAGLVTDHSDGVPRVWPLAGDAEPLRLESPVPGDIIELAAADAGDTATLAVLRHDSLEVWRLAAAGPAMLGAVSGVRGVHVQIAGDRVALLGPDETTALWQLGPRGLTALAQDLPCRPLDEGSLLCRDPAGYELRQIAAPERGTPLPLTIAQLWDDLGLGVRVALPGEGDAPGAHLAWDGRGFISTGLTAAEGPDYLGRDPGGVLVTRTVLDQASGQSIAKLCRLGPAELCAPLPPSCRIEHVLSDTLVAVCNDAWRTFARDTLALRQVVRRPAWALAALVDPRARWLAGFVEAGGVRLWRLGEGTRAEALLPVGTALAELQAARARVVAFELADAGAAALVTREVTSEALRERGRVPLAPRPGRPARLALDGDAALLVHQRDPPDPGLTLDWIDLARGQRISGGEIPDASADLPLAIHAATRRLVRVEGTAVILEDLSGPGLQRVGVAQPAPPCRQVSAVALAPDGASAAIGCIDGDVSLLALPSLRWLGYLGPPIAQTDSQGVTSLSFAPSGEELAAGRVSGALDRIRRGPAGELLRSPFPLLHKAVVGALDWSPAGLVSGDWSGVAAIWVERGGGMEPLVVRASDVPMVAAAGLGPDGRMFSTTAFGALWVRPAVTDVAGLGELLRERATYCPTLAERMSWLDEDADEAARATARCAEER